MKTQLIAHILGVITLSFPVYSEQWNSFDYFPPMEQLYHPVSTTHKKAQEAFDKGLLAIYAFNYDAALQSFEEASQYDPNLAMAYWGMALSIDENLDAYANAVHAKLTTYLCQKALALSENASEQEKAYIEALAKRFSDNPKADKNELRRSYAEAMKKLVHAYPDDLDAATLYAESLMDLLFWDFWESDKTPKTGILEIVDLLSSVLKNNPYHIGANHYYIHALENSPYPERALMSAYRLTFMNVSEWGHLLHTPTHIFMRVGSYDEAVDANQRAVAADQQYIQRHGWEGKYPLKYMAHNLSYLTIAYLWQERFEEALKTAETLKSVVAPFISEIAYFRYDALMGYEVYLYFHRWKELVALPKPTEEEGMIVLAYWTFAQAMAYVHLGEFEKAKEFQIHLQNFKKPLLEHADSDAVAFISNMLFYAETVLQASLARAHGDLKQAVDLLQQAADKQTNYFDFTWFHPIAQTLGATLLEAGRLEEAETIFRHALSQAPKNGRLLFGLGQALKNQGKTDYSIEREAQDALRHAAKKLTLNDL